MNEPIITKVVSIEYVSHLPCDRVAMLLIRICFERRSCRRINDAMNVSPAPPLEAVAARLEKEVASEWENYRFN